MPVETPGADGQPFVSRLMAWYDANARPLPWRIPPGIARRPDPYQVWLAEVMLQQTTVEAAAGPFRRFVARWPTIGSLAAAETDEVMAAWSGLGYYARARNLLACARAVAQTGGCFPETEEELRRLPGIGPYTAAAVAAIGFGAVAVPVDANLARVGARLFGLALTGPALLREAGKALKPLVPRERPGDFAQALMDLGALVCRPRSPDCAGCPVSGSCLAFQSGRTGELPLRPPRRHRPRRFGAAWWVEAADRVALVRRPERGLLGGMLGLPGTPWREEFARDLPFPGEWRWAPAPVVHGFTHFELHLEVAAIRLDAPRAFRDDLIWTQRERIAGLPTLFERASRVALELAASAGGNDGRA